MLKFKCVNSEVVYFLPRQFEGVILSEIAEDYDMSICLLIGTNITTVYGWKKDNIDLLKELEIEE